MRHEDPGHRATSTDTAAASVLCDDALDAVTGGMDCATGMKLARTFITLSKIAAAVGDSATSAALAGRATGVLDGACT